MLISSKKVIDKTKCKTTVTLYFNKGYLSKLEIHFEKNL